MISLRVRVSCKQEVKEINIPGEGLNRPNVFNVVVGNAARFIVQAETAEFAQLLTELYCDQTAELLCINSRRYEPDEIVTKPLDPIEEEMRRTIGFHDGSVKYMGICKVLALFSLRGVPTVDHKIPKDS